MREADSARPTVYVAYTGIKFLELSTTVPRP